MIHDGHRRRLKDKFKKAPKALEDHELFELLLFWSIPRKNTNEEAHHLFERFGDVKGIVDTSLINLQQVNGIGENSALLIKVMSELMVRYMACSTSYKKTPLESSSALKSYLTSLFVATDIEMCYFILFDKSKRLLSTNLISTGDSNGTVISMQKIAELICDRRTAYVVMAHNHPNGKPIPSSEDIAVTNAIINFLKPLPIQFIDHFIVTDDACVPIKYNEFLNMYSPDNDNNSEKKTNQKKGTK